MKVNKIQTKLSQPAEDNKGNFQSLANPIMRASTILFDTVEQLRNREWQDKGQYTYGLLGTPTTRQLADAIAHIDQVPHCLLAPSGLAAINLVLMTVLQPKQTVYLPENVYFPAREACRWFAERDGIVFKTYHPTDLHALESAEEVALVWVETALVAVDATWAAGIALPVFDLGADISIQALTKYQSGGSDVLMGAVKWGLV